MEQSDDPSKKDQKSFERGWGGEIGGCTFHGTGTASEEPGGGDLEVNPSPCTELTRMNLQECSKLDSKPWQEGKINNNTVVKNMTGETE